MGKHRKDTPCSMCNGTGVHMFWNDNKKETRPCPGCRGTGKV